MTKEDIIKNAYGQYWTEMSPWINKEGWFDKEAFFQKYFEFEYKHLELFFLHKGDLMIPKAIVGLENNNGWTKVESQDELPTGVVLEIVIDGRSFLGHFFKEALTGKLRCSYYNLKLNFRGDSPAETITHYKRFDKSNLPIY